VHPVVARVVSGTNDEEHRAASRRPQISWDQFTAVELRVGTVVRVEEFPEARKPAYKVTVDFGPEIGTLRTSAQVTVHYAPEELVGRQVVGVVNFPVKQIGPVRSEFLLTGFPDDSGAIVLAVPERAVLNGAKLC
jgi:tRNA-binding protein